ncbi:MAG: hypothetical protein Q9188_004713 [Gyalolechia gomerana]
MTTEFGRASHLGLLKMHNGLCKQLRIYTNFPDNLVVPHIKQNLDLFLGHWLAEPQYMTDVKKEQGGMVEYDEIVQHQIALMKNSEGDDKVEVAAKEAAELAKKLLEGGEPVSQEAIKETIKTHEMRLLILFHESMALLAPAWTNFQKAAKSYEFWANKHQTSIEDFEAFHKDKDQHERGIEAVKKSIQDMSGPLLKLQRKHVYQYEEKSAEQSAAKIAATKLVSDSADGQEILTATTAYSGIRRGHERYASIVAERTQEYMDTAKYLQDLLCTGKHLQATQQRLLMLRGKVGIRLENAAKEHHEARMESTAKFQAVCAFSAVVGGENAVTKAKESLRQIVELYEQHPDNGYEWACNQIFAQAEGAEMAGDVKGKGKAVEEFKGKGKAVEEVMEALDLAGDDEGEEAAEEATVEEKRPAKGAKGKGKGKGKKKGRGKGKK